MIERPGFKVVRVDEEKLLSAWVDTRYPSFVKEYKVGEWVKDEALFTFSAYDAAQQWVNDLNLAMGYFDTPLKTYNCLTRGEVMIGKTIPIIKLWLDNDPDIAKRKMFKLLREPHSQGNMLFQYTPNGTMVVKQVKLLSIAEPGI